MASIVLAQTALLDAAYRLVRKHMLTGTIIQLCYCRHQPPVLLILLVVRGSSPVAPAKIHHIQAWKAFKTLARTVTRREGLQRQSQSSAEAEHMQSAWL